MKVKINCILSVLIIAILIFSLTCNTYAVTQQELNDMKQEINEIERQKEEIEANLSQERKNIQQLDGDIAEAEYNLTKVQNELRILEKEIVELQEELEQKQKEYDKKYEQACKRVVAQYKRGKISFLDVLLNSSSLTDFLSRYYQMNKVLELDERFLNELEEEKQRIENDKTLLEGKKAKVEEEKKQVQIQKNILSNKKADKQKLVSQLNEEDAKLQEEIDRQLAIYAAKEEEFRKAAIAAGTGGTYSGSLAWPCPGYSRISSYFGSRNSPLAGGSSYHKGVDMAASKGTAILAADSGKVIAVYNGCTHNYGKSKSCGCGSGFGNYLMINHGGGLVTVYGHCTSINVGLGQTVSKGQTIATVGSTGASTGNHLHFAVLVNGSYVNPAPYIGL